MCVSVSRGSARDVFSRSVGQSRHKKAPALLAAGATEYGVTRYDLAQNDFRFGGNGFSGRRSFRIVPSRNPKATARTSVISQTAR